MIKGLHWKCKYNEFGKSIHHDCLGLDLKFLAEFVLNCVVLDHNEIIGKKAVMFVLS